MKIKVGQLANHPELTEEHQIDFMGDKVNILTIGGETITVNLKGSVKQQEVCSRCGEDINEPLVIDTDFEIGPNGDWQLNSDGTIDSDDIIAAAIHLATPLIQYCNKCNK